jgi:hypothetical protein
LIKSHFRSPSSVILFHDHLIRYWPARITARQDNLDQPTLMLTSSQLRCTDVLVLVGTGQRIRTFGRCLVAGIGLDFIRILRSPLIFFSAFASAAPVSSGTRPKAFFIAFPFPCYAIVGSEHGGNRLA